MLNYNNCGNICESSMSDEALEEWFKELYTALYIASHYKSTVLLS